MGRPVVGGVVRPVVQDLTKRQGELLTKFLTKTVIMQAMTCVIIQCIATSLVMQLIIEMHIAHEYTHYVQSRKCIDIRTTGRPAHRHLVRNWTTGRLTGRPH